MKLNRFAVYAWGVLAYNLLVILWGAFVRATGSGAGCGRHWPQCNGEIIPRAPELETMIEFIHRATSGLAFLLVLGMLIWAFRSYSRSHPVWLGAKLSFLFIVLEALIGAGLVLFEWVAHNQSMARAFSMSIHLINTFLLLTALTLTAWWASDGRPLQLKRQGSVIWLLGLAFAGLLSLGVTGALIALGDTLFPARMLAEQSAQELSPLVRFLVKLRPLHPLIALFVGFYLIFAAGAVSSSRPSAAARRSSRAVIALFFVQLCVGALNVFLLVPIWTQLVHLLLSDLIWIALVLLAASTLTWSEGAEAVEVAEPGAPLPQAGHPERGMWEGTQ